MKLAVSKKKPLNQVGDWQEIRRVRKRTRHGFVFGIAAAKIEIEAIDTFFILPGHGHGRMIRSHPIAVRMTKDDLLNALRAIWCKGSLKCCPCLPGDHKAALAKDCGKFASLK